MSAQELPRHFGNYSLLKLLARGGMGEIYLARTGGITGFEKYYAVKRLLKKFTHDTDVCSRFVDEAKLGARLQHPNIVQVYDLGRVQDELYMATEFVDGFDLRRVLRFCHEKKKRIPLDVALFIVREILSGLAYAHRQVDAGGQLINLIHRDISPQNVLVSFEGEVKIIDFGLAKSTQRSNETQANVLLGNFGYMSPEQARGQPLDVRTDVYSTGIVLFELVTGTKRFVEENPLRLLELVARPTPIVPSDRVQGAPTAIDRLYLNATAAVREERFETAEAFRDEVTAALHRINPKASRENLAQFLNHLFLGGQPPPAVDIDALDKSVAVRVHDLHADAAAFKKSKVLDPHPFAVDAASTETLSLQRQARVGDELTHDELVGAVAATTKTAMGALGVVAAGAVPEISDAVPAAPKGISPSAGASGALLTNPGLVTSTLQGVSLQPSADGPSEPPADTLLNMTPLAKVAVPEAALPVSANRLPSSAVVTTVSPSSRRVSEEAQPSIVLAPDLQGSMNDSLIIDVDAGSEEAPVDATVKNPASKPRSNLLAEPADAAIRPAAKPAGRPVASQVAKRRVGRE